MARRHYFDVALAPIEAVPQFTEGWNAPELTELDEYRWCGTRGVIRLPPGTGPALLRLEFMVASEMLPEHPKVTITLNGRTIESFTPAQETTELQRTCPSPPARAPAQPGLACHHV